MDYRNATIVVLSLGIAIVFYYYLQSHKHFNRMYAINRKLMDIINKDNEKLGDDDDDENWRDDADDGRNWKPIVPNGGGSGFHELILKNKEYLQKAETIKINKLEIQER